MQTLHGIAVSPGVAIGDALVLDNERFRIPLRQIPADAVPEELDRWHRAVKAVAVEIQSRCDDVTDQLGAQYGAIFSAHLQMLRDPQLDKGVEQLIRQRKCSVEYAVSKTLRGYAKVFLDQGTGYLAERAHDIFDIEKLLLSQLLGLRREELGRLAAPVVIVAHSLTPSQTANLDPEFVMGFVTETGGAGGHTAIVAEAMEIPAVVGTGPLLTDISGGDTIIIDGDNGVVILQPDEDTIRKYRRDALAHDDVVAQLAELLNESAETSDGTQITLLANIEFPSEVDACLARGAQGVGLYRTEFLYLGAASEPTEEDQFQAYLRVGSAMKDMPVVIRTLDLGADKAFADGTQSEERNPFLGLRSIRLSLRYVDMFRTQLRAILRASAFGNLRLMYPLVSTLGQLRSARRILAEVMRELDNEGIAYNDKIAVGMMVEVPAAVVMLDRFAKEIDFVSIGTNDLTQYTLAVDRSNKEVASLYSASDPAVLRLIQAAVDTAAKAKVDISVCGQMCGNPIYVPLLIGMGIRVLSIPPASIPEIKRVCRGLTLEKCVEIRDRVAEMDTAAEITPYLRNTLRQLVPSLAARGKHLA